jgi:hypothetical protein
LKRKEKEIHKCEKLYNFQELEKFVETDLALREKEQRKYVIFYMILKHTQSLSAITMTKLYEEV